MIVRIVCINKDNGNHDNPHEAIANYGWVDDADQSNSGKASRLKMVEFLKEDENNKAYVKNGDDKAYCYVRENKYGTKFLQTVTDRKWDDNLLRLGECS